jgi:hypothetical protein
MSARSTFSDIGKAYNSNEDEEIIQAKLLYNIATSEKAKT